MRGLISRIASRVFLAFTCRRHVVTQGFGYDGSDKGVAVFDYRHMLIFWAYPKDDKVKIVHAKSAQDAFSHLCSHNDANLGDVGKKVREYFRARPRAASLRNFKILLWNEVMENDFKNFGNASFIVGRTEVIDYESAKTLLTTKYDFSLKNFYAVFGGESSMDRKFECEGMMFEVNDSSLTQETVVEKMRVVKTKLASLSSSLLYGSVELKSKFLGHTIADYSPSDDIIRIDSGGEFVTSMIHELGHRWHYKMCNAQQNRELKKLYNECRKPLDSIECEFGDTLVFRRDGREYVIMGEDNGNYLCYKVNSSSDSDDTVSIPKNSLSRFTVESINGFRIGYSGNSLPRHYAGKNFYEFVACCFEHTYGGLPILRKVERKFRAIVEEK